MTHDELCAALILTRKIDRLQASLDDLRESGGLRSPKMSERVQGGASVGVGQIAVEIAAEIEDLEQQRRIEQAVIGRHLEKCLLDDTERKVMRLRYVECLPWKIIKSAMGYEIAHVYRLHDKAKNMIVNDS